jgi:hypothetical protein
MKYQVTYYAWISTRGEKRMINEGSTFAGLIRDVPKELKPLVMDGGDKQYCRIDEK